LIMSRVTKVLLFTVTACPIGRNMDIVIKEVCTELPQLEFEVIYTDLQHEITNRFCVSNNPTIIILDRMGKELYRVKEFTETDDMLAIIKQTEAGKLTAEKCIDATTGSIEEYFVYLLKDNELAPVRVTYYNKTSVKSPRISAIKCLIIGEEGYVSPFPPSSELLSVRFDGSAGEVVVRVSPSDLQIDQETMREALLHTLGHFGILQVNLELVH